MTRKQALCKALELLSKLAPSQETTELIGKLEEIRDELPFTKWSETAIHDTLTQFAVEQGRNPTATDLKRGGLPPHPVIKLRFGMTAKEFLDTYYPPSPKAFVPASYGGKSKKIWTHDFIRQFHEKNPTSGKRYNETRETGSPSWQTIAKYNGVKGWHGLLSSLGLSEAYPRRKDSDAVLSVSRTITLEGKQITDEEWRADFSLPAALAADRHAQAPARCE